LGFNELIVIVPYSLGNQIHKISTQLSQLLLYKTGRLTCSNLHLVSTLIQECCLLHLKDHYL